jgi:hypothetical protein
LLFCDAYNGGTETAMTYRGHIKNGHIMLDGPVRLPEGAEVNVEVVESGDGKATLWKKLLDLAGTVEGLPPDAAERYDQYLNGTSNKR